jgi:hypothetical protein
VQELAPAGNTVETRKLGRQPRIGEGKDGLAGLAGRVGWQGWLADPPFHSRNPYLEGKNETTRVSDQQSTGTMEGRKQSLPANIQPEPVQARA